MKATAKTKVKMKVKTKVKMKAKTKAAMKVRNYAHATRAPHVTGGLPLIDN